MESIDVIKYIGDIHEEIESFYFFPLQKQWLLQDRIVLDEKATAQMTKALQIRESLKLPFWDCMMLSSFCNPNYSETVFDAALCHRNCESLIEVKNDSQLILRLAQLREGNYAWNSLVKLKNGDKKHILMLDFHIPIADINLPVVKSVLRRLEFTKGMIINSGESFHAISTYFVDEEIMINTLQKALFFSPIIDRLWVAHQMINKSCSLRIGRKHGLIPEVMVEI